MNEEATTIVVQRYLNALGDEGRRERIVRDLIARRGGLRTLCASLLTRALILLEERLHDLSPR